MRKSAPEEKYFLDKKMQLHVEGEFSLLNQYSQYLLVFIFWVSISLYNIQIIKDLFGFIYIIPF